MRDYAKLCPTFWTGTTGRALRRRGHEAVIVALYLVSAPGSNMLGLYYQPKLFIAHETGLGIEGASKGLIDCISCGFCSYDDTTEMVFVHEMAAWQIGDSLKPGDKRCAGVQKDYDALPANPFLESFFHRYRGDFHLTRCRDFVAEEPEDLASPLQAPCKPLRCQEQEQEQEQDITAQGKGLPDDKPIGVLKLKDLIAEGVEKQVAADWLALRKAKRLPLTPTAWDDTKSEGLKAGLSPPQTVAKAVASNWAGFKASWLQRAVPDRGQVAALDFDGVH